MSFVTDRSNLVIVSDPTSAASHRIRLIVEEKALEAEKISISVTEPLPADFLQVNPSGKMPTLFDRDLQLTDERVISEYLDERYPHPALMPIDPIVRAKLRMMVYRVESDWYSKINLLETNALSAAKKKIAIKELRESISLVSPLFRQNDFLLSDNISLLDCAVIPIFWRLLYLEINLPEQAKKNLKSYMERMFSRDAFQKSLSYFEKAFPTE